MRLRLDAEDGDALDAAKQLAKLIARLEQMSAPIG
jgi:hypothetical protein